jgi:hypothetical protein
MPSRAGLRLLAGTRSARRECKKQARCSAPTTRAHRTERLRKVRGPGKGRRWRLLVWPPARRCWRLGSVRKDGLTIGNNFAGDVAAIATELRGALGCGALRRVRRLRRTVVSAASVHVPAQGRSRWARALPSADAAQGPP